MRCKRLSAVRVLTATASFRRATFCAANRGVDHPSDHRPSSRRALVRTSRGELLSRFVLHDRAGGGARPAADPPLWLRSGAPVLGYLGLGSIVIEGQSLREGTRRRVWANGRGKGGLDAK